MPYSPSGYDPTQTNFSSRDEAEQYMFSKMCPTCKKERERFLAGESDEHEFISEYPLCTAQWEVMPTAELLSAMESDLHTTSDQQQLSLPQLSTVSAPVADCSSKAGTTTP